MSRSVPRWLIIGVLVAGAVGAALAIAGVATPVRAPLVLIFLAAAPALAVTSLLGRLDRFGKIVIAGIAAIVVNFAVAETMIASGAWSPAAGVAAVGAVSVLMVASGALVRRAQISSR
jgi:hypothetical protein